MRLQTELVTLDGLTFTQFDAVRVEEELRSYLTDWPSLAQRHPVQTRQILRKLLPSRIRVWREVRGGENSYHFQGEAAVGRSFNGLVSVERSGVPKPDVRLSMPHLTHLIIPFSGEIQARAA